MIFEIKENGATIKTRLVDGQSATDLVGYVLTKSKGKNVRVTITVTD